MKMDCNEAIKILIEKQHEIEEYGATDIAIEALEKQIAKKPSLVGMQNKCPNIDCIENVLRYYNYCSECGQKIDWNKD